MDTATIPKKVGGSLAEPVSRQQPLIRLTARLADGTRVSVWRAFASSWAAIDYATDVLGARYASARVIQPARVPA